MNPLHAKATTGAIGELLVQLRLLQFDVQAAPPLRDSGNDLIAIRGRAVRSIQVKTRWHVRPALPSATDSRMYDAVALVHLTGTGSEVELDGSTVYLIPREMLIGRRRRLRPGDFVLREAVVNRLFEGRQ